MSVTPTEEDFDDMHHALGRPAASYTPSTKTYRNHYCVDLEGHTSRRFKELGWWSLRTTINDGRDALWVVNDTGKAALAKWLRGEAQ